MTEEIKSSTKYVMVESSLSVDEDEIDLLELIRTLLQAWKIIVGITIVCVGLAVTYALHAPGGLQGRDTPCPFIQGKVGCIFCPESIWWIGLHCGNFHTQ